MLLALLRIDAGKGYDDAQGFVRFLRRLGVTPAIRATNQLPARLLRKPWTGHRASQPLQTS
ncbi:MAG: hypothetical protein TE42_10565 [Candidatus Synechococcus spongiarum SP3]|uniref:Uncharacterized protein n=1 Tax=Candidatus Synechococcus spongiarum SP3 TaxID=1604020 RepID=A0A0G2IVD6_9SYNE|nr:MAG: hypothetical protein TE42_10565 [Candidatus Synechococcus spongiarum SP3]